MEIAGKILRHAAVVLALIHLACGVTCGTDYVLIGSSCYRFNQAVRSASEAEAFCNAEGSSLADINGEADKAAIIAHINANFAGTYWTAGRGESGRYVWGGSEVEVPSQWRGRRFRSGSDMCVYVCSHTHRLWEDLCSTPKRYICKQRYTLGTEGVEVY
ncbi:asialoglycoprotein receptor 2 [Hyalella azteca]|uniref:Asialoglycoprotein receptor 2 n=1 Tax=Hyalella azteca TaxID=294128 RepID=A0A8B7NXL5_HYAAZ|nr:asialoglycoprotein receptor 2 [Hyalella azteca]